MGIGDGRVDVDVVAVAFGVEREHLVADAIERIEPGKSFGDVDPGRLGDQRIVSIRSSSFDSWTRVRSLYSLPRTALANRLKRP